jgi:hypothetical protein
MAESEMISVREWDPDVFQRRVLELEAAGYTTCLDSYQVSAEMDPETGEVIHLRSVELCKMKQRTTEHLKVT